MSAAASSELNSATRTSSSKPAIRSRSDSQSADSISRASAESFADRRSRSARKVASLMPLSLRRAPAPPATAPRAATARGPPRAAPINRPSPPPMVAALPSEGWRVWCNLILPRLVFCTTTASANSTRPSVSSSSRRDNASPAVSRPSYLRITRLRVSPIIGPLALYSATPNPCPGVERNRRKGKCRWSQRRRRALESLSVVGGPTLDSTIGAST